MRAKFSFQIKLFLCLVAFSCVLLMVLGAFLFHVVDRQMHRDLGNRAKVQASEIALIPNLPALVEAKDTAGISRLITPLSQHSDASYIVIGDSHEIHLYHSSQPQSVNHPMVGGDNAEVLAGKTIISIRQGGIGVSLRSKAPIINAKNQVVGIVSVGYLTSYINDITLRQLAQALLFGLLLLLALFLFSWLFSKNLKKQMFWLEPRDISLLVRQQKALMEAIYEGVVAIDDRLNILTINRAARELLGLEQPEAQLIGQPITDAIATAPDFFTAQAATGERHDEMALFNQRPVIVNRVPLELPPPALHGWVFSFRDKNDINTLSSQLSQVTRYADNLRIMRHEQLNWTATLAGLLQMQRYDEALRYVQAQSEGAQAVLDFVSQRFKSPALCGLLLGKYVSAKEKGIELDFDPGCQLAHLPAALGENELMSIVGNLIDNAVEASLKVDAPHAPVELYLTDSNDQLIIEVADSGGGIDADIRARLFEQGVSSKPVSHSEHTGSEHGIGLYVVASYVRQAQGMIEISDNRPQGTVFTVFIPFINDDQPPTFKKAL
ncbi:ATP-binding protein [Rouxiella badensis]|jgi:two-component system cit operon sensor histidine kinase CitA|uniref:ATP-binding protein n=1 Tax=Rouxiella badensis TaxID=1646377 RepID=UPI0017883CCA|nr:sensor histidine kinase [Rouxiella badensis]QOI53711.1 sensor histidine kinase [Rouxiella badensis subsp. acadiensis]